MKVEDRNNPGFGVPPSGGPSVPNPSVSSVPSVAKIFFILGLPRSRTAWLANFFTWGKSFCFHEALRQVSGPGELPALFARAAAEGYQFIGDADPSALLYWPEIKALFPEARVIRIHRNPEQARLSHVEHLADVTPEEWAVLESKFESTADGVTTIPFDAIERFLPQMWKEIFGNAMPFPLRRAQMLAEQRITAIPEKVNLHAVWKERMNHRGTEENREKFSPGGSTVPTSSVPTALHIRYNNLLAELCGPRQDALVWLLQMLELQLTWDHIADRDEIDLAMADRVFESILLDWPLNPFWREHGRELRPVVSNCIAAWRSGQRAREFDGYSELPCAVALLIGGQSLVRKFSNQIRELTLQLRAEDDLKDTIVSGEQSAKCSSLSSGERAGVRASQNEDLCKCRTTSAPLGVPYSFLPLGNTPKSIFNPQP